MTPHFFPIYQMMYSRLPGWSPDRQGSYPRHLDLVSVVWGHLLIQRGLVQPASWTQSNGTQPQRGIFALHQKLVSKKKKSAWRSSSQLLRASGQSRGFQVTLEFSHCTSVQGAKVKVKRGVCDVEVSGLFDEVHNLGKTEKTAVKHEMHFKPFKSAIVASETSAQAKIFTGYTL